MYRILGKTMSISTPNIWNSNDIKFTRSLSLLPKRLENAKAKREKSVEEKTKKIM